MGIVAQFDRHMVINYELLRQRKPVDAPVCTKSDWGILHSSAESLIVYPRSWEVDGQSELSFQDSTSVSSQWVIDRQS
jgi:hypothetical protein